MRLDEMGRKGTKIADNAIMKGATVILDEMKKTSSFSDRTGNLRKKLSISKPVTDNGRKIVKIGINKSDNSEIFYGKFIEYGTTNRGKTITAKPYMRPALENKRKEALEIAKNEMKKELGI
jgi:HK97 gp10 family phage protein